MNHARILLVEDEPNLRRTLTDLLRSDGYLVESSGDGVEGQELATKNPFDLIILDVMLPSRDGFEVCRCLRENGVNAPVLMLTARNELNNKVQGLKAGSDDYLTKPFETPELEARIEALLRRAARGGRTELKAYDFDRIHIDFSKSQIVKNGKTTSMGERESRLLRYLVEREGTA